MTIVLSSSLKTASKGTALVFAGTIGSLLFAFATKLIIIRQTTQEEFGIYSLAIALVSVFTIIATLGLSSGTVRFISILKGRGEDTKGVIVSSLQIVSITGILSSLVLYLSATFISENIFGILSLKGPLKIISLSIPFSILSSMIITIFRGHGIIKPRVYFKDLGRPFIFFTLILIVFVSNLNFISIIMAYFISYFLLFITLLFYSRKKLNIGGVFSNNYPVARKKLLLFSIPLIITGLQQILFNRADKLMIGFFLGAEMVGVYSGGLAIAKLLTIPLTSLAFVYLPLAGTLYSQKNRTELKRVYQIQTKWVFSITFPLFIMLFLFPEEILKVLFGEAYLTSANILRVLATGFMFHTFMGLNGTTLVVLGESKVVMLIAVFASALNIFLNYSLISLVGVMGAAIATLVSYVTSNIVSSIKLFQYSRIHPITLKYLKPVITSSLIAVVFHAFTIRIQIQSWMLPFIFIFLSVVYILSLILTKSIDEEDILMFKAIENRSGLDLKIVKKIANKFL